MSKPFLPGFDPRRNGGRKPGTLNADIVLKLQAARQKLMAHAEELVDGLLKMTKDDPNATPCPVCGRGFPTDIDIKLKAIIAAMDRLGLGPSSKVEVEHTSDDAWVDFTTEDEARQLLVIMESARGRMSSEEMGLGPPDEVVQ